MTVATKIAILAGVTTLLSARASAQMHETVPLQIEESYRQLDQLIPLLGHEAYATRQRSRKILLAMAASGEVPVAAIRKALLQSIHSDDDLESQLAAQRLLLELERRAAESERIRFLHDPAFQAEGLPGWTRFSRYSGDSPESRLLFVELLRDGLWFAEPKIDGEHDALHRREASQEIPERNETARWCLSLIAACERADANTHRSAGKRDAASIRLSGVLRNPAAGPLPKHGHHEVMVQTLIDQYLKRCPIDAGDRLVIALRFRCERMLIEDCRRILDGSTSSATLVVTALLAAASPTAPELDLVPWLDKYSTDRRVSHRWRSLVPERQTRHTQIADVVHAIRLQRRELDPRKAGYEALIADPILVFQPYSLGFPSEHARQTSREIVEELLGTTSSP